MKILVINSGSTSLKYQLIDSGSEVREAKGTCARIGTDGRLTHESVRCAKFTEDRPIPDHHAAMELVLQTLLDPRTGVLKDVSEIDAIGHRVLHGGPAEDCCQRLLDIALSRGAPDNVTVVLLQM